MYIMYNVIHFPANAYFYHLVWYMYTECIFFTHLPFEIRRKSIVVLNVINREIVALLHGIFVCHSTPLFWTLYFYEVQTGNILTKFNAMARISKFYLRQGSNFISYWFTTMPEQEFEHRTIAWCENVHPTTPDRSAI